MSISESVWCFLLRASCYAAVVIPLAWLACAMLRHHSRSVHCWIWRIAYLKIAIASVWIAPISVPVLPAPAADWTRQAEMPLTQTLEGGRMDIGSSESNPGVHPMVMATQERIDWTEIAIVFWAFGVLIVIFRAYREWALSRHFLKGGVPCRRGVVFDTFEQAAKKLRLNRRPQLLLSNDIDVPVLAGLIRPAIVVPQRLPLMMQKCELELLFLHEMSHLLRADLIWNVLPRLVNTILFFHPMIWLARQRWYISQEVACDELVLQSDGVSTREYGAMLLAVATQLGQRQQAASLSTASAVAGYRTLHERLTTMQHVGGWTALQLRRAWLGTMLLSAFCLIPWQAVPRASHQAFTNGGFESGALGNWKVTPGANASVRYQEIIPFDIDASGPGLQSQALSLSVGQLNPDPDQYIHVDITQSLRLEAGKTYAVSFDWAAKNRFAIDNFDGGVFELVVGDRVLATCNTENLFTGSVETGTLYGEFTAWRSGRFRVGARVKRRFPISFPNRSEPVLQQVFDNFVIQNTRSATSAGQPGEGHPNRQPTRFSSTLHVTNQKVKELFKAMRQGTYRSVLFPELGFEDIPALLNLAGEQRVLSSFPTNAFSSQYEPTCREGIVAIWLIEGIRVGGKFPSLNALCLPVGRVHGDWTDASNEAHDRLLDAYRKWWKAGRNLTIEEMKQIDPLEGTGLHWH